ncbi:PTS transporter subunit EIIC, partial [Enterococcus sp. S181_ASV_20]|nr:PTS transporter subunit EIIC [Enterococcus sp. S181_ASV_20]
MPDVLSTLFIPFLTILITTPIVLSLLAPLGSIVGNSIGDGLLLFSEKTGFLGVGVLAAIWQFLVMTGMHVALIVPMFSTFFETGQASGAAIAAGFSICLLYTSDAADEVGCV